jgi:uncharacterized lipoprotein NlpE involved in copper resistance
MCFRRNFFLLLVLAAVSFSAGPLRAKTVELSAADSHTTVALNLGDTLIVVLQARSLDYRWQAHVAASSPLTELNDRFMPVPIPRYGVGTHIFRFNAIREGQMILTLSFDKRNKPSPAPQTTSPSTFSVNVDVRSGEPGEANGYTGTDQLFAVYKGTLPCADCSGMDVELRLYGKGKFDTTDGFFVRSQTYLATRNGNRIYTDRGQWAVLKGDAADPQATVYRLIVDRPDQAEYLLLQGDLLTPLDRQLRPIPAPANNKMNLSLHRAR